MIEIACYILLFVYALIRYHFNLENAPVRPVENEVFMRYDEVIKHHLVYYNHLSETGKHRFINRCVLIKQSLRFQGREGFTITDEVRILLSACLTQLTYGFQRADLPFMKGVIVFPEVFYSRMADSWVKGLAMGNGTVFISWADFIKGYENNSDTYNLGLHEFAHMLNMQADESFYADKRISEYYQSWRELSHPSFLKLRNQEEDFFRAYGGTNTSEFFSVCVEHFFEVPQDFEKELPELFYHLCYLLKQNPLNLAGDYQLTTATITQVNDKIEPDLPVFQVFKTNFEYRLWHILSALAYVLFFGEFLYFLSAKTETQLMTIRFVFLTAIIFMTIRWHHYSTLKSVAQYNYLKHLFFELIPIALFMLLCLA